MLPRRLEAAAAVGITVFAAGSREPSMRGVGPRDAGDVGAAAAEPAVCGFGNDVAIREAVGLDSVRDASDPAVLVCARDSVIRRRGSTRGEGILPGSSFGLSSYTSGKLRPNNPYTSVICKEEVPIQLFH